MYLTYCMTVFTAGITCAFGCSPQINYFLSSSVLSTSTGIRKALGIFARFYLGKIATVSAFCLAMSYIGSIVLLDHIVAYRAAVYFLLNLSFVVFGTYYVVHCIREHRGHTCHQKCMKQKKLQLSAPIAVGAIYGASPCAPMLMVLGYAATVSMPKAIALGWIFTLANAVSPLLFFVIISGYLSKKMAASIPQHVYYIRLLLGAGIIIWGIAHMLYYFVM